MCITYEGRKIADMDYDKIINEYLEGRISREKARHLQNWLKSGAENVEYFDAYVANWSPHNYQDEKMEKSLIKARKRLINKDNKNGKAILLSFVKYAAVIALAVVVSQFFTRRGAEDLLADKYCEVSAAKGHKSKVVLPDGSTVILNADSKLKYSLNFDAQRRVELSGEACFDITKSLTKEFKVVTNDYSIIVHGTMFNVMAYEDFNRTETTLIEGSVSIRRDEDEYALQPGEKLIFEDGNIVIEEADIIQAKAWADEKFNFNKIPFRELVLRLERWYDVEIEMADDRLNDIVFTGVFRNEETIWQVLDYISISENIGYKKKGHRNILIYKK